MLSILYSTVPLVKIFFYKQVSMALLTHKWYRVKFEDYPKSRKAIFPYIL